MHRSGGRRTRNCVRWNWSSMSGAIDRLIDLIVGKGLADQRDTSRYERESSSMQARNETVTRIDYESMPRTDTRTEGEKKLLLNRTASVAGTIPKQGSIKPPRVRTQSAQPAPKEYVTPCGAPDISCADIPEEQIARTYSRSCIWDSKTNPVPPFQEMEGFGRFRRSVHADADWQLSKFRGDLQTLGPAAVQHLGDFEIAKLQDGVMNNIRTPSGTSLTSYSDSGESSTGTRICRGFNSSRSYLAAASGKNRNGLLSCTKSCAASFDCKGGACGKLRPNSKRTSFFRINTVPALLATIDETGDTLQKKKTVPLIFNAQGAADEVIEDDEYEPCEESLGSANGSATARPQGRVANASRWHEKKGQAPKITLPNNKRIRGNRNYRTFDHIPEKARSSQKKPSKPLSRKLSSCGGKTLMNGETSKENVVQVVEKKTPDGSKAGLSPTTSHSPLEVFSPKASPLSSEESVDPHPALDLCVSGLKASATAVTNEKVSLPRSISANCIITLDAQHNSCPSTNQGKNRSKMVRAHSGKVPVMCIEGDMNQLLDMGKLHGMNLQAVAA